MSIAIKSIAEKDRKAFYLLALLIFNIFTTIITGENAVESLLISHLGSGILPKMYIINAFFLFLVSFFFLPVIDRIERGRFFYSSSLIFCIIILFSRFFIYLGVQWIYPFLYVLSYTMKTVLFIIFWTIANDISDTREAKLTFPLIAGAGILGNLFASLMTGFFVKFLHTQNLLYIWTALLVIGMGIFRLLHVAYQKKLKVSDFLAGTSLGEVKTDFIVVQKEPLLRIMAIIFALTFLLLFNIDFQFYRAAGSQFPQVDDLARFLGFFKGSYASVTFLLQFFIVSYVFNRFGIAKSMVIVPVSFMAIVLFLWGVSLNTPVMFGAIVAGTFFRFVIFESIFSPTYQIFFSSVRKNLRGKGKAFIEAIIKPLSIGAAGLFILLLVPWLQDSTFLVLTLVAGGLLYATIKLKNWYTESLIKTVAGIHYDDFRTALESFYDRLGEDILPFLEESLKRETDINVRLFIIEMIGEIRGPESNRILRNAFGQFKNAWLRASIISSMRWLGIKENLSFFIEQLNERDHRIRANAIEAITELKVSNVSRIIEHYAHKDPDARVRANALISLWKLYGDPQQQQKIITTLYHMLDSDDKNDVSRAVYVMGQIREQQFIDRIMEKLHHPESSVRRSGIWSLSHYRTLKAYKALVNSLDILEEEADQNLVITKLTQIGGPVMGLILEHLNPAHQKTMNLLLNAVRRVLRNSSRDDQLALLGYAERDKLTGIALQEIEYIYQRYYLIFSMHTYPDPHIQFLKNVLREKTAVSVNIVLQILSILDPTNKIASVSQRFRDTDEHVQADIFELLENVGKPEIIDPFIPVLESNEDRISQLGARKFKLKVIPLRLVLQQLIADYDLWTQAVAIHTAGKVLELSEDKFLMRMLKARTNTGHPFIRSLAEHALKQKSKTIIKSISTRGERTMLDKDLLKEKFTIVERVIFFKKLPLFKNVDSERLKLFAEIVTEQTFRKNDLIVRENDIGEFLYIVKSGSIKVVKNYGKNETVLSIIREMGYFGEMGLIDNEPRSASCVANEDCSLLIIGKENFLDVLYRSPEISLELFRLFTQRIREGNESIKHLTQELEKKK